MDSKILAEMFDQIETWNYDIHSVTVIRNGYKVVDATIYPFQKGSKHNILSCTKSIVSALIGIAIEQGYIESVEQPVLSFFSTRTTANLDADKEAMTLEHLLMMAPGLECRDSYLYNWQGADEMMQTDDWVQYMLDLPMAEPPGTRFEYCNGASFLLSAIIQETTGMTAAEYAQANLFDPLGISDVAWGANHQGITLGWGDMYLQPQDMAKIGYLYLNEGRWDDEQIIPSDWVTSSTRKHITATLQDGYGYQWWIAKDGVYIAQGYKGQFIYVVPDLDLVVAFTGHLPDGQFGVPEHYMEDLIIPAVKSSDTLPPNRQAVKSLESKIQQLSQSQDEPKPVPPLPPIADRVTGRTYVMDPNPFKIQSVSLLFGKGAEASLRLQWNPDEAEGIMRDPEYWKKPAEWSIGLDDIYRFSPDELKIPVGVKGLWQSGDIFVIYVDFTGFAARAQLQFTFEGDQVFLQIKVEGESGITGINGRLEE
jgi:CubicO group peptidase (beta-lactamase class C family)